MLRKEEPSSAKHYKATLTESSPRLTVNATITNCEAFGFLEAVISMGSCDLLFGEPTGAGDAYTAPVHVKCSSSTSPITITAGACKATVGEQTPGGHMAITNNTDAGDAAFQGTVTGIKYSFTQDGFLCPFNGTRRQNRRYLSISITNPSHSTRPTGRRST